MTVTSFISSSGVADFTYDSVGTVTGRSFTPTNYGSAGDTMVVLSAYADQFGSVETAQTPSGWTLAASTSTSLHGISALYKVLDGSETSDISPFTSGADIYRSKILTFTGPTSVSHSLQYSIVTSGNPTSQLLSISGYTDPLVVIAFYSVTRSSSGITNDTFSPSEDGASESNIQYSYNRYLTYESRYKVYNSSPSNTTVDLDDDANTNGFLTFVLSSI